jgi:hypothetical protein
MDSAFLELPRAPRAHEAAAVIEMRARINDPCARYPRLCEMHRRQDLPIKPKTHIKLGTNQ